MHTMQGQNILMDLQGAKCQGSVYTACSANRRH